MSPTMSHGDPSASKVLDEDCAGCHKLGVPLHANDDPNPVLTASGQKPRYVQPCCMEQLRSGALLVGVSSDLFPLSTIPHCTFSSQQILCSLYDWEESKSVLAR
jgi:hypothetical protein